MPNTKGNTGFALKSAFTQLKPNSPDGRIFGDKIVGMRLLESRRSSQKPITTIASNGYVCRLLDISLTKTAWKKVLNIIQRYQLWKHIQAEFQKPANASSTTTQQINIVMNPIVYCVRW